MVKYIANERSTVRVRVDWVEREFVRVRRMGGVRYGVLSWGLRSRHWRVDVNGTHARTEVWDGRYYLWRYVCDRSSRLDKQYFTAAECAKFVTPSLLLLKMTINNKVKKRRIMFFWASHGCVLVRLQLLSYRIFCFMFTNIKCACLGASVDVNMLHNFCKATCEKCVFLFSNMLGNVRLSFEQ